MKTILYCGHLSGFGLWCTQALLGESYFEVTTIILGDINRWEIFYNKLSPGSIKKNSAYFNRKYNRQLKELKRLVGARKVDIIFINDANDSDHIQSIPSYDLMICAAFPQIFSTTFLKAANQNAYNFHPSFLPRCRGANPVYWTIVSQEPYGGISCHVLTKELDRGDIAAQVKIDFDAQTITYELLNKKIKAQLPSLLMELKDFFIQKKKPIKQDNSAASFFTENLKIHRKIYWQQEHYDEISAKIRAGSAFTLYNGKEITLLPPVRFQAASKFVTNQYQKKILPGTIVHVEDSKIIISIIDGYIITHLPNNASSLRSKLAFLYRSLNALVFPTIPKAGDFLN